MTKPGRPRLPLNPTSYYILAVLSDGAARHAYGMVREIRDSTGGEVALGLATFYTNLERLLQDGLVERDGAAIVVDGRARQNYRITALGERVRCQDDEARRGVLRTAKVAAS
jgi:DNA-binding PadR family transcriptional regulator